MNSKIEIIKIKKFAFLGTYTVHKCDDIFIRPSVEAPQEASMSVRHSVQYICCFSVSLVYLVAL